MVGSRCFPFPNLAPTGYSFGVCSRPFSLGFPTLSFPGVGRSSSTCSRPVRHSSVRFLSPLLGRYYVVRPSFLAFLPGSPIYELVLRCFDLGHCGSVPNLLVLRLTHLRSGFHHLACHYCGHRLRCFPRRIRVLRFHLSLGSLRLPGRMLQCFPRGVMTCPWVPCPSRPGPPLPLPRPSPPPPPSCPRPPPVPLPLVPPLPLLVFWWFIFDAVFAVWVGFSPSLSVRWSEIAAAVASSSST